MIRTLFVSDILPRRPAGGAVRRMDVVTAALAELGPVDGLFLAPSGTAPPPRETTRFARTGVAGVPPYTGVRALLEITARGPSAAYAAHQRRTLAPGCPTGRPAPATTSSGSTGNAPGCRCAAGSPAGRSSTWTTSRTC
ncbi:hypothetical protein ACFQ3Z_05375 [Streptomyces nogalater]